MFEVIPFEDKMWFTPVEKEPIKLVFERGLVDRFTREDFEKIVSCEKMSPLSKAVNDGALALMESWAAFGKAIYNPDGTEDNKLRITNYTYNKPVTKIEWSDGTVTKVSCNPDEADQFSGFLAAIAKKMFPDYLKEYEKYTVTIPKQEAEEKAKKAEEERRTEKRRAKREAYKEKRRKIKAAKALAEQYQRELELREIEKIASEKFGVPKSYFGNND